MNKRPSSHYLIRFSDCDPFGHLNNARYLDYFNNARQDHLKETYQLDLTDFYAKGSGWVAVNHNISYLKPAAFNEKVYIQSALLVAAETHLLVELLMMDEAQSHLKAFMWTKFVPVSIRTGKKENHTPEFMEWATSVAVDDVDIAKGPSERLAALMAALKK